ncbi:hypothetical protein DFH09DRAFT_1317666 [Mycena vulgaris]|nr:hypothetical protein DFH09DRAFT_1317666 [Mycena vulgaris]
MLIDATAVPFTLDASDYDLASPVQPLRAAGFCLSAAPARGGGGASARCALFHRPFHVVNYFNAYTFTVRSVGRDFYE